MKEEIQGRVVPTRRINVLVGALGSSAATEKKLKGIHRQAYENLAIDGGGQTLTYLAPTRSILALMEERWPGNSEIPPTREHHLAKLESAKKQEGAEVLTGGGWKKLERLRSPRLLHPPTLPSLGPQRMRVFDKEEIFGPVIGVNHLQGMKPRRWQSPNASA